MKNCMTMIFVLLTIACQTATADQKLSVKGRTQPDKMAEIGAKTAGNITEIHYKVGDMVKKGQKLLTLYPTPEAVDSAKEQLEAAKAAFDVAEQNFKTAKKIHDVNVELAAKNAISKADFNTGFNDFKVRSYEMRQTTALVKKAVADIEVAKSNLDLSYTYAEVDGVVTHSIAKLGKCCYARDKLGMIADIATLEVVADLPDAYRLCVEKGDTVLVRKKIKLVQTIQDKKRMVEKTVEIQGRVLYVNDLAHNGVISVLIAINNKEKHLAGYMDVEVEFIFPN